MDMKSIDVRTLSDEQLRNLMGNHRTKGATDSKLYLDVLQELEKRTGKGLDFEKSMTLILSAAKEQRFISYKELADGSEANWSQVHYSVGGHLWKLVEYAHGKGWPMLSAIVVNKPNVNSGRMEPETLKGFISAARQLGYDVTDQESFLREQQERVFKWASAGPD